MGFATGYKDADIDVVLAVPKRVWTAITTAISRGHAFCYNGDIATDERGATEAVESAGSGRHRVVEKPTLANIADFAGFAAQDYPANASGQWIEINVPRLGQTLTVCVKADCSIMSSVLGPIPTQHHVREGCLYPEAGFALLALQTVDRSSTAGEVQCRVIAADSPLVKSSTFEWWDDFVWYGDTDKYAVAEDAAKDTLTDAAGGVLQIAPDTTEENASCVSSAAEIFLPADGKPIRFRARISASEAGTDGDENNFAVGLSDLATVDLMKDAGAGPADSFDGVLIWKADSAAAVFQLETSNLTAKDNDTNIGAFVKDTFYDVEFLIDPNDGTTAAVNAWVDKVLGTADALDLTLAGLAEMHLVMTCKCGNDDVNAENLKVDYVQVLAVR